MTMLYISNLLSPHPHQRGKPLAATAEDAPQSTVRLPPYEFNDLPRCGRQMLGKTSVRKREGGAAVAAFARCAALFWKNFRLYRESSAEDPSEDVDDCSTVTEEV